jgi:hypothetical protein
MNSSENSKGRLLGLGLFLFYFIQVLMPWKSQLLIEIQSGENYRLWTGGLLFAVILSQWILTYARFVLKKEGDSMKFYVRLHKLVGIYSPVIFFVHSADPGYGLLLFLTAVFFLNHLIGVAYGKSPFWVRLFPVWIILHVFLAFTLLTASVYHVYVVFAYKGAG